MKVKKPLFSVLFFGLVLSFCLTVFPSVGAVKADELQEAKMQLSVDLERQIYADLYNAFPDYIGSNKTIGSIKQLHDFAGNSYYDVEFVPFGFAIYDGTFTVALEINAVAESPYFGLSQDLIYAGPTHYYVKPEAQPAGGSLFAHTVLDTTMVVDGVEKALLIQDSNALNFRVNNHAEKLTAERNDLRSSPKARAAAVQQVVELSSSSIITDLNTGDFNKEGNCGYVAAAILVYYQSQAWGSTGLTPNGFSNQLVIDIQNGRANSATESGVRWAISDYIKRRGTSDSIIDYILPNASTIYNLVNENRPVIIGARNMPKPNNGGKAAHMVVVHKVERTAKKNWLGIWTFSDYNFWVHYGWGWENNKHFISESAFLMDGRVNFN